MRPTLLVSKYGERLTVIGAIALDGVRAWTSIEKGMNGDDFIGYIRQHLNPTLRPGDVLVMDGPRVHRVAGVEEGARRSRRHGPVPAGVLTRVEPDRDVLVGDEGLDPEGCASGARSCSWVAGTSLGARNRQAVCLLDAPLRLRGVVGINMSAPRCKVPNKRKQEMDAACADFFKKDTEVYQNALSDWRDAGQVGRKPKPPSGGDCALRVTYGRSETTGECEIQGMVCGSCDLADELPD
jgi:hypothetical protein